MGKLSYNDKLRMQTLWQISHCLVYTEWLCHVVDSTADFRNSAQLLSFIGVTGTHGFITKSSLTKHLHAQFQIVRQFSHW